MTSLDEIAKEHIKFLATNMHSILRCVAPEVGLSLLDSTAALIKVVHGRESLDALRVAIDRAILLRVTAAASDEDVGCTLVTLLDRARLIALPGELGRLLVSVPANGGRARRPRLVRWAGAAATRSRAPLQYVAQPPRRLPAPPASPPGTQ